MNESLFFQYAQKYFPQLVLSVVEMLNEKHTTTLPYLYKDMLTPTFSADGRWASIQANYTRVTADIVALDSELPLKSRDSLEKVTGDIPKIGMKKYLTEKQLKDIDTMMALGMAEQLIVQNIFNDLPNCIEGVWERIEDIFQSGLSSGVGLASRNNGVGIRIDYGYKPENQFGVATDWTTSDTASAVSEITAIIDKAMEDGNVVTNLYADDAWLKAFYKNKEAREQYAFLMNFVGSQIPTLSFEQASSLMSSKWNIKLHRVNRRFKTEANGVKSNHTAWQKGVAVFTCDEVVGNLTWTTCAEVTRPVPGVIYENADQFILVSQYSTNDPLREFTSSQAMVIPVINNVDRIYTLNCTDVRG